jgi:hypothetical protein
MQIPPDIGCLHLCPLFLFADQLPLFTFFFFQLFLPLF